MKNLFKIQVTFKEGYGKKFKEEYDELIDPITVPEGTMNQISENVFEFLPWPDEESYTSYDAIDFLNTFDLYEHEHFEITDSERIAKEEDKKPSGNVWQPISAGNNDPEYVKKMEAKFGKNWRDLFNGL